MPRVLIIDDEAGIRFALQRWFARQGWLVLEANDGEQGLEILRNSSDTDASRIDVVICDLRLPKLTGDALHATLRTERPSLADRLILSTGGTIDGDADADTQARYRHILHKPFELSALRSLVDSIMTAGER